VSLASPSPQTIFLLSPAHCGGRRAQLLLNRDAGFPLAIRLREHGVPLGEVFSFLSGLYFRGKLAYARRFASARPTLHGSLVITPGSGLQPVDHVIKLADLQAIASVGVSPDERRYTAPLLRDARALAQTLERGDRVVLLGSIATGKYLDVLERTLDGNLRFPEAFVGRGDMSRGGLMLRCAQDGRELDYVPTQGAVRHGPRPPRLEPIRRATARAIES